MTDAPIQSHTQVAVAVDTLRAAILPRQRLKGRYTIARQAGGKVRGVAVSNRWR
jgi:hypothetical protein